MRTLQWDIVILFSGIVLLWALMRPASIRDDDNRRLPRNVTARLFLVAVYLLAYLILVGAFHTGGAKLVAAMGDRLTDFVSATSPLRFLPSSLMSKVATQAPYTAFSILACLMCLAPCREIERRFLIWSHGSSSLHGKSQDLALHLEDCDYVPTDAERERNISTIGDLDVILTDHDTRLIDLESVQLWRKTNVLLRLLEQWNEGDARILNKREIGQLQDVKQSHERKTRLALGVVNMLAHGGGSGAALSKVQDLLSVAAKGDRQQAALAEAQVGVLVGETGAEPSASGPVRLSSADLRKHLAVINNYLLAEYKLIVRRLGQLAAKSVVLSGDVAPRRLEALKSVGFKGLGRIDPISVNSILRVFLIVGIGGFLVFYLLRYRDIRQQLSSAGVDLELAHKAGLGMLMLFASFSLIMAIAALIGAMVGSRHDTTPGRRFPWRSIVAAGTGSAGMFFLIHWAQLPYSQDAMLQMRNARMQEMDLRASRIRLAQAPGHAAAPSADQARIPLPTVKDAPIKLRNLAPWSTLPFLITVGICLLGQLSAWPRPARITQRSFDCGSCERVLDGLAFAALMIVGVWLARVITDVFGLASGSMPNEVLTNWQIFVRMYLPMSVFGFLIGAAVVHDVRIAAHSRIVEQAARPASVPAGPGSPRAPIGIAPVTG